MTALVVPDGLPLLIDGEGDSPADGGCLMQFVSYIADESWTTSPWQVHRMLASVAIYCNDSSSDAGRPLLAQLAPDLIGTEYTSDTLENALTAWVSANVRTRALLRSLIGCADNPIHDLWLYDYLKRTIAVYCAMRDREHAPDGYPPRCGSPVTPEQWAAGLSVMGVASPVPSHS